MNQLHTEARGRFRWLQTVEHDDGLTIRTARTELPTGLVIERVDTCQHDGADVSRVFVTDPAGCEVTLSAEQSTELGVALGELP